MLSGDMETCVRVARNVISFELLRASTRKVKDVVASSLLLTSMFMTSSQAIGAKNSIESARAGGRMPIAKISRMAGAPSTCVRKSCTASMTKYVMRGV